MRTLTHLRVCHRAIVAMLRVQKKMPAKKQQQQQRAGDTKIHQIETVKANGQIPTLEQNISKDNAKGCNKD